MAKTIAVTGATGVQGGSVARKMLEQGWNVRAITRNTNSDAAKKLVEQGAEVVQASFEDESSLVKAFKGAQAVFAVTNFWEHMFTGKTAVESGEMEKVQALALARAAAKSSTLEHYVWSTIASARKTSGGRHPVPHMDSKAEVDEFIHKELPELAKKTTFLWFGYYASNMVYLPFMQPFEWPGSYGTHIWLQPTSANTSFPNAGDMTVVPGIWVAAIVSNPDKTKGKYATAAPEAVNFRRMLEIWASVTGKRASFVECSKEDFINIWGRPGEEFVAQLRWGEDVLDWTQGLQAEVVSMEELGISAEGIGHKAALETIKRMGLL